MKKLILLFTLLPLMISCHSNKIDNIAPITLWSPDMTTADVGRYPLDTSSLILNWNSQHLPDPELISDITFSEPRAEYLITDTHNQQAIFGYAVCIEISNVKAAIDDKPSTHWYLIYNDQVIQHRQLLREQDWILDETHSIDCHDPK